MGLYHNAGAAVTVTVTCAEREGSRRSDRSRAPTVTAHSKHLLTIVRVAHGACCDGISTVDALHLRTLWQNRCYQSGKG